MPYVITTTKPSVFAYLGAREQITRRAVATLEEARDAVDKATGLVRRPGYTYHEHVTETGGTIGPLPDGTVIEVRRVKWRDVTNPTDWRDHQPSQDEILDAYNAK